MEIEKYVCLIGIKFKIYAIFEKYLLSVVLREFWKSQEYIFKKCVYKNNKTK